MRSPNLAEGGLLTAQHLSTSCKIQVQVLGRVLAVVQSGLANDARTLVEVAAEPPIRPNGIMPFSLA